MKGIIAGNFDVIHPGYIEMFNGMKKHVGKIHVLLHIDPSLNRPAKIKLTNSSSNIIYKDLPEDDPKRRRPDINLAKSILDWSPIIDLETGLQKTINYFNNH